MIPTLHRCKQPAARLKNVLASTLSLFCISKRKIRRMPRVYTLVKMTLVTSHHEVIVAFKAWLLLQAINLEILCNLCTEKCENNAYENADTFNGWLCDFLSDGCLVKCYGTDYQRSFRFRELSVTYGIATVQKDAVGKIKCYFVKKI